MLRFFRDTFGMVISIVMAMMISLCMAVVGIWRNPAAGFTAERLLSNWGPAFLTIMTVSILLPVKYWGDRAAARLKLKAGTIPFGLVSNLVPTFFFNTVTTCVMVGVNLGFGSPHYWQAVAGDWLPMFAASYALSFFAEKLGYLIAVRAGACQNAALHI